MGIDPRRILYCDDHILVVNKLSGELVVRGKGAVVKLPLLDFLRRQYPGLRAVHRLDFETSGVVVFARTREALQNILSNKFVQWKKMYVTIVTGRPQREGVIRFSLPARSVKASEERRQVPAVTRYRVLEQFRDAAFLEVWMEEGGRRHQIRQHLARIGHPLALDDVYGDRSLNRAFSRSYGYRKFFLHAASLSFPHPATGNILTIEAPLPRAFDECLERLQRA
ncbi:hypothetical protein HYW11_02215 [Candidatus Peregrinibacteria bacterium]|nr:hypothetical protein [Candidatus Peregrinibacteria bacterium]